MRKTLITVILMVVGLTLLAHGQANHEVSPGVSNKGKKQLNETDVLAPEGRARTTGIRFVLASSKISKNQFYMPVPELGALPITVNPGMPGGFYPFPVNDTLVLYDQPLNAERKFPGPPVINKPLPSNHSAKMLCVVLESSSGLVPIFVDLEKLGFGSIYMLNLTTKPCVLYFPEASKSGIPSQIVIESAKDYYMMKKNNSPDRIPCQLMRQEKTKQGKELFFPERKMLLQHYSDKSIILIFGADPTGKMVETTEIPILF